jgi:hypothetical protein
MIIPRLSSPSVCVIDEDPLDFGPLLDALLKLGIGCVHIYGDSASPLPASPIKGLRVVFADLHLNAGSVGKTTASHTANVFKSVVSSDTAPVLVVIWSKHAGERSSEPDLPPEDQPTQAELFKEAVLLAEPQFCNRLIFTEIAKPSQVDRPADWVSKLQEDIAKKLGEFPGCEVLWYWESLVRDAAIRLSQELTSLALHENAANGQIHEGCKLVDENLQLVMRHLAQEQGGPACDDVSAPRHLAAILAQSLADELEHTDGLSELASHGEWLSRKAAPKTAPFASRLNGLLLTAASMTGSGPFVPGTVYRLDELDRFEEIFGVKAGEFSFQAYQPSKNGWSDADWASQVKHVFIELSPACDFHQKTRKQALLVAGLLVPAVGRRHVKRGDAFETLPDFNLRWPASNGEETAVFLTFCSRYKFTHKDSLEPSWLSPWFRLRELPTASLRNWHAGHSARVGYVSVRS